MTSKVVCTSLLLILAFSYAEAQSFLGLQGGISRNYFNTNISNRSSTFIHNEIGYAFNVSFQHQLKSWLGVRVTPNITQKNYSINRTDSFAGIYARYNNTYLQLPLLVHFIKGKKKLQVFADIGTYIGYWLSGRIKANTPDIFSVTDRTNPITGQPTENFQLITYNVKYLFNSRRDRRLELGWITGVGLQYKLKREYSILVGCTYYQSLTDQQKKYMVNQIPSYNQTFVFSFGGTYRLK